MDWYPNEPRFEVVYHLLSLREQAAPTAEGEVDGGTRDRIDHGGVALTANYYEREVFDLFGIRFEGHPNLRRIMMPERVGRPSVAQGLSGGGLPIMDAADYADPHPLIELQVDGGLARTAPWS